MSNSTSTTAIVHAADGVRFVATASCLDVLFARLAEYVRGRCDDMLVADSAWKVRMLLNEGNLHAAVMLYFARTGERWDEEELDLSVDNQQDRISNTERMTDAQR